MRVTIEDLVAEGDTVVVRDTTRATHRGAFAGIPPTGKEVRVARIALFRLADGRIAEHWGQVDMLGLLQQLGAVPAPGGAPG
jgi:predicted ester cyclase